MAKVTLTDLTSLANDTSAVNSLNTNFQTVEDYINNNVLSRDTGVEVNTMQNDLDFNSNNIVNVTNINGSSVADITGGILTQVTYAEEWAQKAEDSAVSTSAGGDGATEFSALHHSAKANAQRVLAETAKTAAETAQGLAETAKTNAQAAQTAAETAQGLAETAQTNTEAVYDTFDDRYLGAKASDPTLDNDGDALLTGALYFNTTSNETKVYSGSAWINISVTAATVVSQDSETGAADIPAGTTAQRPAGAAGEFRFNSDTSSFEGYDGSTWGDIGGGGAAGRTIDVATTGELAPATTWVIDTSAVRSRALAASPTDGDEVGFVDEDGLSGTNNATIARTGTGYTIAGAAADFTVDVAFAKGVLKYNSADTDWKLVP